MPTPTPDSNPQRWISTTQAAEILSIHRKSANKWARDGEFTAAGVRVQKTLGGHYRLLEADVLALMERLTRPVTNPWDGGDA